MDEVSLFSLSLFGAIAFVLTLLGAYVAYRKQFFAYPKGALPANPLGRQAPLGLGACLALVLFLLVSLIGTAFVFALLEPRAFSLAKRLSRLFTPAHVVWMWTAMTGVALGFCSVLGRKVRSWLWQGRKPFLRSLATGAFALLVAYPAAELVINILGALLLALGADVSAMQAGVAKLQAALRQGSFLPLLILMVVLAPVLEELFFRGFLQSWLRRYLRRGHAIGLSAFLFALAHLQQGIANLLYLPAIFLLGLFLGYLFERERTLLASITLHALFNLTTVTIVLISG